uniref:Uncharacterized protein n=1 Tax=Phenylobacterium glaciei TaxID=2803784 RepID=A0A974S8M2_9CAUL|nr:hypothetical protein JKL49_09420 [Phenylobacterium glaciei]
MKAAITPTMASRGTNWMAMMVFSDADGTASRPVENRLPYWRASRTTKPRLMARAAVR